MKTTITGLCLMGVLGLGAGGGCATSKTSNQTASATPDEPGRDPSAVPPDKMEEIQEMLRRKAQDISHCWAEEAGRRGDRQLMIEVMVKLTVQPSGRADKISIVKTSLPSKE